MKIAIITLDPTLPWNRKEVNVAPAKLEEFRKNPDQIYVRAYWQKFVDVLSSELTRRGHEVKIKVMKRWDVQPQTIAKLQADLVFIPHTSAHLFEYDKPAFYYMQVMQAWLFSADPKGWSSKSSRYPAADYIKGNADSGVFERYKKLIIEKNASKFKQKKSRSYLQLILHKDVPAFKPYIFFPCQIPHDESILYNSDVNEIDVVSALAKWCNDKKIPIVFKRHPANLKSMKPLEEAAKGKYIYWSDASIHDVIKHSRAVYTINSGVGFESMLHEKPVVTFGKAEYDAVTIHADLENLNEVWQQIESWNSSLEIGKYKTFYDWFCRLYCIDLEDEKNCVERAKTICDEAEKYVLNATYEKAS